jgi:predicted ATP-grasp superfamily ATP-dependent carboligase
MTLPEDVDVETRCAACGEPGHRYGRNEGIDRWDSMACINTLRGRIDDLLSRLRTAETENVRYREALERIANETDKRPRVSQQRKFALAIAEAALKGETE